MATIDSLVALVQADDKDGILSLADSCTCDDWFALLATPDATGALAIYYALKRKRVNVLKLLLEQGAILSAVHPRSINTQRRRFKTYAVLAVEGCCIPVIDTVLEHYRTNEDLHYTIRYAMARAAIKTKRLDIIDKVIDFFDYYPSEIFEKLLIVYFMRQNLEGVIYLLRGKPNAISWQTIREGIQWAARWCPKFLGVVGKEFPETWFWAVKQCISWCKWDEARKLMALCSDEAQDEALSSDEAQDEAQDEALCSDESQGLESQKCTISHWDEMTHDQAHALWKTYRNIGWKKSRIIPGIDYCVVPRDFIQCFFSHAVQSNNHLDLSDMLHDQIVPFHPDVFEEALHAGLQLETTKSEFLAEWHYDGTVPFTGYLSIAIRWKSLSILKLLLDHGTRWWGVDGTKNPICYMLDRLGKGNIWLQGFYFLITLSQDPDKWEQCTCNCDDIPLYLKDELECAIVCEQPKPLEILVDSGILQRTRITTRHYALLRDHPHAAKLLLDHGMPPYTLDHREYVRSTEHQRRRNILFRFRLLRWRCATIVHEPD